MKWEHHIINWQHQGGSGSGEAKGHVFGESEDEGRQQPLPVIQGKLGGQQVSHFIGSHRGNWLPIFV